MINKTFRLFISSTFSDFLKERQILNEAIQAEINSFCQSMGYFFQLIDLRWGVNSESALMQNTLSICLEEVRRCTKISPKPNFLLLLGERYGWIPLPQKISHDDFDVILSVSTAEELCLLCQWYRLDENECEASYFLDKRSGEYENDENWKKTEDRLRTILKSNAVKAGLPSEKMMELTISATEREIIDGLLDRTDKGDNVIAVFRNGFPEKDPDLSSVLALRQRIKDRMQQDELSDHILEFDYGAEDYATQFQSVVTERLKQVIGQEIQHLEAQKKEIEQHHVLRSIMSEGGSTYCQRADLIRQIQNYVCGENNVPLFIIGEPGSGKSTMLADFLGRTEVQSFYVFFGHGEYSYNLYSAISYLSRTMLDYCSRSTALEYSIGGKALATAMRIVPPDKKILLVLDGLDAFYDLDKVRENLIPSQLPSHIKMIVSSANKTAVQRFMGDSAHILEMDRFSPNESQELLRMHLACKGRCISRADQNSCITHALSNGATPLQIKLLAALCAQWRSSDNHIQLPATAEDAVLEYIRTQFLNRGHNMHLVLYALALVAVSPMGITEDILTDLLLKFADVQDYFKKEDRYQHNLNKMPFAVWSRFFFDLNDGLQLEYFRGSVVVRFRHQLFRKIILRMYPKHYAEAIGQLERYFVQQPHYIANGTPYYLKLYSYPILLKEQGKSDDLQTIFIDLDYVDASIKAGLLNRVIPELMSISSIGSGACENRANEILSCIQQYQERLLCNQGDFLNCAYDCGLINGIPPILSIRKNKKGRDLYFPHSSDSKIIWNEDHVRYAVLHGTEVWICNADPYMEYGYINVTLDWQGEEIEIINAFWFSQEKIGIQIKNGYFLVYSYARSSLHLFDQFSFDPQNRCAVYIPAISAMAYIHKGNVCVRGISEKEIIYRIPLQSKFGGVFGICEDGNTLILCQRFSLIEEYDLHTGQKLLSQKVKLSKRHRMYLDASSEEIFNIRKLGHNCWLLCCPQKLWYTVIDSHKVTYLQFPILPGYEKRDADLQGQRFHIVCWDRLLMLIDFSEEYKLRFYPCQGICDVAWLVPDQRISVLTDHGLHIVSTDDFQEIGVESVSCLCSNLNLQYTMPFIGDHLDQHTTMITAVFKTIMKYIFPIDKDWMLYDVFFRIYDGFDHQYGRKATIVAVSYDCKKAVAYEGMHTIVLFDAEDHPKIVIDRLELALNDNIMGLFFSPDGKFLIIWKNQSLVAIDTDSGRYVLLLDVSLRPVLFVSFDKDGSLMVSLCDKKTYRFTYNRKTDAFECTDLFPEKLITPADTDDYFGPYTVYPLPHKRKGVLLIHGNSFENGAYLHLRSTRIYHSDNHWLLFKNGEFYLDGDQDNPFSHPHIDFLECLNHEKRKDDSSLSAYLREKNDTLSLLLEPDDRHLVLISRGLNAVLVFNLKENLISAMYKLSRSIIGVQKSDGNRIELLCCEQPEPVIVDLVLPCP